MILFRFLDRFLQLVRRSHLPFGGMQLICAMDPLQFVVTLNKDELKDIEALYPFTNPAHCSMGFYHGSLIIGGNWCYALLNENIRSKNIRWSSFLKNARTSELTEDDLKFYNDHVGSKIPYILQIKWLLINYLIYKRYDNDTTDTYKDKKKKYEYRIKNNLIILEHSELISSIDNILKFNDTEATKNTYNRSENITILATENITVTFGNKFNLLNIEELTDYIMSSNAKRKFDCEYNENEYIEKVNNSIIDILKKINISNNDDQNVNDIPKTDVIQLKAEDSYYKMEKGTKTLAHLSTKQKDYFSSQANRDKKQLPQTLDIIKGTVATSCNSSELYIDNNQRLKVLDEVNGTLHVEPLYDHGLKGPNRYIKKVTRETVIKDNIIVSRFGYPIQINSALMVSSCMGIQLDGVLFDNSRHSLEGNGYIAAGRVAIPERFKFAHGPKTVKEFNAKYFKCNAVSKRLDDHLISEKNRTNCNIIPINFKFNFYGEIIPI